MHTFQPAIIELYLQARWWQSKQVAQAAATVALLSSSSAGSDEAPHQLSWVVVLGSTHYKSRRALVAHSLCITGSDPCASRVGPTGFAHSSALPVLVTTTRLIWSL